MMVRWIAVAAVCGALIGCGGGDEPPAGVTDGQWAECLQMYGSREACLELKRATDELREGVREFNEEIEQYNETGAVPPPD